MRSKLLSGKFWENSVIRAVKTFAQSAVAVVVANQVSSLIDVDFAATAAIAGLAAVLSLLTSVSSADDVGAPVVEEQPTAWPPAE